MQFDRRDTLGLMASLPLLGSPSFAQLVQTSRPRALVIGVDNYRSLRPLTRAVADANAIAGSLSNIGYVVSLVANPDLPELRSAMDAHIRALEPETPSFLFFAGHAVQLQGTNLLLPVDTRANSAEALGETCLPIPFALQQIARRRPSQSIVMLDACRDDPFLSGQSVVESGIASVNAPGGFFIVYSAGSGETALDRLHDEDTDPNGVFTRSLLPQLNPHVPVHEIVMRTKREVARLAASIGHAQHPAIYDQTSEPVTLLGRLAGPGGAIVPIARPTDPQSRFLSIGLGRYSNFEELVILPGAAEDAQLVGHSLRSCGIDGDNLVDPADGELEQALSELAQSSASTVILYYAGYGAYDDGDAVLVSNVAASNWDRLLQRSPRLGEIVRQLRRPRRRIVVFMDSCLARDPGSRTDPNGLIDRLQADPAGAEAAFGPLALFTAAKIGGAAYDLVPGQNHGPFATAVRNAIGRPNQRMTNIAQQIHAEVVQITASVVGEDPDAAAGAMRRKRPINKGFRIISRPVALRESRRSILPEPQEPGFWATPSMADFTISQPLD